MKTFLKENWFKLVLAICILLIGTTAIYYYLIYIPKQNELAAKLALEKKQEECKKSAYDLYEADVKISTEKGIFLRSTYIEDPKYFYNKDLDRCFYHVRISITGGFDNVNETIIDVRTSEIVAKYHWDSSMDKEIEADKQANEEFGRLYDKYMPNAKNYESMH